MQGCLSTVLALVVLTDKAPFAFPSPDEGAGIYPLPSSEKRKPLEEEVTVMGVVIRDGTLFHRIMTGSVVCFARL